MKIKKSIAKGMMVLGSIGTLGIVMYGVYSQAAPNEILLRRAESVTAEREAARSSLVDCFQQGDVLIVRC